MDTRVTAFSGAHHFEVGHQTNTYIAGNLNQYFSSPEEELFRRLNPILDASHTRNRARSPPDSECFPGTRQAPIHEITVWAGGEMDVLALSANPPSDDSEIEPPSLAEYSMARKKTAHIYWLHGFAGCGKSSISLAVGEIFAGSGRLLASYFFFRGAGDRSTMNRFASTLAIQLVAAIPATAPLVQDAVRAEPGLVTGDVSLARQLDRLVISPFQTILGRGDLEEACAKGPFLIVVDGLDECEDKQGVEDFINHMVTFFENHPSIPLRLFIASRVEEHIRVRLSETDVVQLGNLDGHSPDRDIEKYLHASFQAVAKRDRVIRAYVTTHGEWPAKSDMDALIKHIGGSFLLASIIFKYIVQPATIEDPLAPMERFPLALKMNGLDGLYTQILTRSQHLPHFQHIVATIAELCTPMSIVGIANLIRRQTFEVIRVLLNLQGIVHVPGTDDQRAVWLCHTSLRDFLRTESRSGCFFVPCSFNLHMAYSCFASLLNTKEVQSATMYSSAYLDSHLFRLVSNYPDAKDFNNEVEQFVAQKSMFTDTFSPHVFLCTMFFYFVVCGVTSQRDIPFSHLIEWSKHFALAMECPDGHLRPWLNHRMRLPILEGNPIHSVRFTEQAYKTVQQHLRRITGISTAIRKRFPELSTHWPSPTGVDERYYLDTKDLSGIHAFRTLEWIVAHSHTKWKEAKKAPSFDLELFMYNDWTTASLTLDFHNPRR